MVSPNKIIGILNNNVLGLDIGSAAVLAVLSALGQDFNLELTSAADDPSQLTFGNRIVIRGRSTY